MKKIYKNKTKTSCAFINQLSNDIDKDIEFLDIDCIKLWKIFHDSML